MIKYNHLGQYSVSFELIYFTRDNGRKYSIDVIIVTVRSYPNCFQQKLLKEQETRAKRDHRCEYKFFRVLCARMR